LLDEWNKDRRVRILESDPSDNRIPRLLWCEALVGPKRILDQRDAVSRHPAVPPFIRTRKILRRPVVPVRDHIAAGIEHLRITVKRHDALPVIVTLAGNGQTAVVALGTLGIIATENVADITIHVGVVEINVDR